MKTKTYITMLTLAGFIMMSCTSSLQVSNSSSWNDEIYGTTSKPQTVQLAKNDIVAEKKVDSNLNQLEQKYSDVIEINMDSIKNDTIIYKAEETNPYERILSDSYQESYERRLRGRQDPGYGLENWSAYYSDDYRYAQAYDPAYYNIVVMGGEVWLEPWYISNMFGYPRSNYWYGFGFGFTWALPPWHVYNYYNLGGNYWAYNYPYLHYTSPWNYNPYWSGWNDGYWHGNNNNNNYYGRRSTGTTDNTITKRNTSTISGVTGHQSTVTGRREGSRTTGSNPVVSTRNTQTRVTPTYESGSRSGSRGNQVAVSRREGSSRSERPTREIGISEPTRRSYNTTYDRSRTSSDNARTTGTRQSTSTARGASSPTYNSPGRVSTPSSTSRSNENSRSSSSSSGSYNPSRGSSSSSSGSYGSSSSSGRSSSSSSSSSRSESSSSSRSGSGRR